MLECFLGHRGKSFLPRAKPKCALQKPGCHQSGCGRPRPAARLFSRPNQAVLSLPGSRPSSGAGRTFPLTLRRQIRREAEPGPHPLGPGQFCSRRLWVTSTQLTLMWGSWEIPLNPPHKSLVISRNPGSAAGRGDTDPIPAASALRLSLLGRSLPWEGRRPVSRQRIYLLSCPRGGLGLRRRAGSWLRTCFRARDWESSEAAAPARCSRRPSSGFSLSSLSGFYRQLLVGDINCPD